MSCSVTYYLEIVADLHNMRVYHNTLIRIQRFFFFKKGKSLEVRHPQAPRQMPSPTVHGGACFMDRLKLHMFGCISDFIPWLHFPWATSSQWLSMAGRSVMSHSSPLWQESSLGNSSLGTLNQSCWSSLRFAWCWGSPT